MDVADDGAREILSRLEQLKSERSTFDAQWDEVAEYVGTQTGFSANQPGKGEKRGLKAFDSTARIDLSRFAATMSSLLTPQNERWHKLDAPGQEGHTEDVYLDDVTRILFEARYSPTSGFPGQMFEAYESVGAYGTAVMAIMDSGMGIKYRCVPLREVWMEENWQGQIDTVYREYSLTARQAVQQFGDKTPEIIRERAGTRPGDRFTFVQKVCPNAEVKGWRKDFEGMEWASYDICVTSKKTIQRGGYRKFPFAIARFSTSPGETYGRSPAMQCLATIKMLNEMKKTTLRASHKAIDPTLLMDGSLQAFASIPGAVVQGGVVDGKAQVIPLQAGGNIPLSLEMMDRERATIHDSFFVSLFEILAEDRRNMTAQEVMQRAQEKGQLLGPVAGNFEASFLGPLIERELDILEMARQLPRMPQSLEEQGGAYEIKYTSPISLAQKAGQGVAALRFIEAVGAVAQYDPNVVNSVDADELLRVIADAQGVKPSILRDKAEVSKRNAEQQQQNQAAAVLQGADVAANAARSLAQAQAYATAPGVNV